MFVADDETASPATEVILIVSITCTSQASGVIVTVYVPAHNPETDCVVCPLLQLYVAPAEGTPHVCKVAVAVPLQVQEEFVLVLAT